MYNSRVDATIHFTAEARDEHDRIALLCQEIDASIDANLEASSKFLAQTIDNMRYNRYLKGLDERKRYRYECAEWLTARAFKVTMRLNTRQWRIKP